MNLINCSGEVPIIRHGVIVAQQVTVSITCVLSLIGSGLIILIHVAFKDLRTGARQILVHLSIADIIVVASHMFGVLYNLPTYTSTRECDDDQPIQEEGRRDLACEIQAGFTMFGVLATYLWTLAMAVYLLVIIVFERNIIGKRLRLAYYPVCWGIPLITVIVFGTQDLLGFDDSLDIGWCYTTWINESNTAQNRALAPQLFGHALWSYLTFLLLPILYLWIRCYIRVKLSRVHKRTSTSPKSRLYDVKLTFIPLIFVLLRLSALGLSIPHQYLSYESRLEFRATWWNVVLVLIAGVGTSAQGLVNAILFCAFTRVVRQKLTASLGCLSWRGKSTKVYLMQPTPPASGGGFEDSTESERGESPGDIAPKKCLLNVSDSIPKYGSTNQCISYTTE